MSKHPPEQWRMTHATKGVAKIVDDKDYVLAVFQDDNDEHLARIVACVNACVGINPEAVPDLLDLLRAILDRLQLNNGGHSLDRAQQYGWAERIRRVITKAKGGG